MKLDATDPLICTLRLRTVASAATLSRISSISGWGSVMLLGRISSASRNSLSNWNLITPGKHKKTNEVEFIESRAFCCGSLLLQHISPSKKEANLETIVVISIK